MILGTETGSLMNHLYARGTLGQPTPEIGMGATLLLWSDRHAATITAVEGPADGWTLTVQRDQARVIKGSEMDGSAEYAYAPNPHGMAYRFRFKDGVWRQLRSDSNRMIAKGATGLRIGDRREYRDPGF